MSNFRIKRRTSRWRYLLYAFGAIVFGFLIAPLLVIVPLSFNAEPFFTFTPGMVQLDSNAYSLRWYQQLIDNEQWRHALKNSVIIALSSASLATVLGTVAALGLSRPEMPFRTLITGVLLSPMIVPIIVTAAGMYFFYSSIGLAQTLPGVILAHAVLGTPFVVITVTAAMSGFDPNLLRAAASLGAGPIYRFFTITMPLILPGIVSGALFAVITSFDEVVCVLFLAGYEQRTIPRQMWSGIREQISPTILAAATILTGISIVVMITVEIVRRRAQRWRTESPGPGLSEHPSI